MSKRITVNGQMRQGIYGAIHEAIMQQRLGVAKKHKYSVDSNTLDKMLFDLQGRIFKDVLEALGVAE